MERSFSKQLPAQVGQRVLIKGWLHTVRELGKISFLIVRDAHGLIQVVVDAAAEMQKLAGLQTGSIVQVQGVVKQAPTELGVEVAESQIQVLNPITAVSPIDISKDRLNLELDTLLDERVVALRHPKQQAIFRIQQGVKEGFRAALKAKEFVEISSPKLLAEASEGGTNFFKVPYFGGTEVYLAQSPQFYKQMMVGVFERVFEIGPVFRAEKHNTSRHMSEYVSLDAEMGFIESWTEIMDLVEYTITSIIGHIWEHYQPELTMLGAAKPLLAEKAKRLKITEIHELMFKQTGEDYRGEPDLEPAEERFICQYAAQHWGSDLVFATHFPTKKRPFYTYPSAEDPEETYSADLLFRGLEIVTGGQRINNYDQLVANARKWGVDLDKIRDYLDTFKYGMPAEGGFGMGLERVTAKLAGLDNVKEASLFPTDLKRAGGTKLKAKTYAGGEAIRDAILKLLAERELKFEHQQHEETPTSEDSARVRGTQIERGVKAIMFAGKSGKNYLVNVPGNLHVDTKAVSEAVAEKVEMEKPEAILQKYGLQIGGVPPFGNLMGVQTLFANQVLEQAQVAFNCGLRTESIVMGSKDLVEAADGQLGDFAK